MFKFLNILLILGFATNAFAGSKYNSLSGHKDFCVTIRDESGDIVNDHCQDLRVQDGALTDGGDYFLLSTQVVATSVTSMTSTQTSISTSYSLVRKAIAADPAYSAGTLPNGRSQQILTIFITEVAGSGTFTVTPTTKTGFTSVTFDAAKDMVTFLYVNDAIGWIIISNTNATINVP